MSRLYAIFRENRKWFILYIWNGRQLVIVIKQNNYIR